MCAMFNVRIALTMQALAVWPEVAPPTEGLIVLCNIRGAGVTSISEDRTERQCSFA